MAARRQPRDAGRAARTTRGTQGRPLARCLRRLRLPRAEPVHVDIKRAGDAVESVKRRDGNAATPELNVVFAYFDPFGCFGGTDVRALHRPVEPRGHCAPQGIIVVTAFKVSNGLGMSAHLFQLSRFIYSGRSTPARFCATNRTKQE